jgi:succinate dehydrogenase / fumarate reductase iron-sulfur subunit
MRLKVFRFDPESGKRGYDTFELEPAPGWTVLDALFAAQDVHDDSLSFRYSCRGAVCGSCAMLINKVPRLACRTQVRQLLDGEAWDAGREIIVEPLPHLTVIKDLVVDMERFFAFYRAVEPVLKPAGPVPEREYSMAGDVVRELEKYTNCILCGACVGACPVNSRADAYLGPAALAKLYRFHIDTRDQRNDSRLLHANSSGGWWGCEFHTNCMRVCPKGVPPNLAIGKARRRLAEIGRVPPEHKEG